MTFERMTFECIDAQRGGGGGGGVGMKQHPQCKFWKNLLIQM